MTETIPPEPEDPTAIEPDEAELADKPPVEEQLPEEGVEPPTEAEEREDAEYVEYVDPAMAAQDGTIDDVEQADED